MKNLLGVVMCGGESRRMGTDKGLIKVNEITWAERIAAKFLSLNIPVLLSINSQQYEPYGRLFTHEQLIVDDVEIGGPLKGLLSVHQKFPGNDILLMACDMIDMEETTIQHLVEVYEKEKGYDFYVYYGRFAEPFCAIYTAQGLKPVMKKARLHELEEVSFQSIISHAKTFRIQIRDNSSFGNYNIMPGHHQHP